MCGGGDSTPNILPTSDSVQLDGGGAYTNTLHAKAEKMCNLQVIGGMRRHILYHTQSYHYFCGNLNTMSYFSLFSLNYATVILFMQKQWYV